MVTVRCRSCGMEVDSDETRKKCPHCGELFPFECAVCGKHLRPPIPHFPVEKYFTEDNRPLCQDHYQRQCPECGKWFRADENPGYYMCAACSAKREAAVAETQAEYDEADDETESPRRAGSPGCFAILSICLGSGFLFCAGIASLLR